MCLPQEVWACYLVIDMQTNVQLFEQVMHIILLRVFRTLLLLLLSHRGVYRRKVGSLAVAASRSYSIKIHARLVGEITLLYLLFERHLQKGASKYLGTYSVQTKQ